MHGVSWLTWLAAALIIAILLGATIAAVAAHVDLKRRKHRRPRSWDHIEEQWPSPAARGLDDTGSMILGEEIGWRRRTGSPLLEPADFDDELPFPELLDDLPDDPNWPAKIREALDDEEQERLAQTGELRAIGNVAEFTGLASQAPALTGDWTPRPDPDDDDLDDPALDQVADVDEQRDFAEEAYWREFCGACGVSPCCWDGQPDGFHTELDGRSELDEYLDDLKVLTRYRIPAE